MPEDPTTYSTCNNHCTEGYGCTVAGNTSPTVDPESTGQDRQSTIEEATGSDRRRSCREVRVEPRAKESDGQSSNRYESHPTTVICRDPLSFTHTPDSHICRGVHGPFSGQVGSQLSSTNTTMAWEVLTGWITMWISTASVSGQRYGGGNSLLFFQMLSFRTPGIFTRSHQRRNISHWTCSSFHSYVMKYTPHPDIGRSVSQSRPLNERLPKDVHHNCKRMYQHQQSAEQPQRRGVELDECAHKTLNGYTQPVIWACNYERSETVAWLHIVNTTLTDASTTTNWQLTSESMDAVQCTAWLDNWRGVQHISPDHINEWVSE